MNVSLVPSRIFFLSFLPSKGIQIHILGMGNLPTTDSTDMIGFYIFLLGVLVVVIVSR
jgi:hypothetical protein